MPWWGWTLFWVFAGSCFLYALSVAIDYEILYRDLKRKREKK